jgi:hypothetical protein
LLCLSHLRKLSLGTAYRLERERSFLSLANNISATYDARAEENFGYVNLSLNAGHQLGRLSLEPRTHRPMMSQPI